MKCPKCGGECERDEADVGIGTIGGPWGCPACHWVEEKFSLVGLTFSLVGLIKQAHALQDAVPKDARGWQDYFVRLALETYDRAVPDHGGPIAQEANAKRRATFTKHARERFAQAAQVLVGEFPRTLKMHFDCDEGSLALGTPPHDIFWTAEGLDEAKRVRDVFTAHGIPVEFTSDCEIDCDGQRGEDE